MCEFTSGSKSINRTMVKGGSFGRNRILTWALGFVDRYVISTEVVDIGILIYVVHP